MTSVMTREDVLTQRLEDVREGNLLLALFELAEELGFGSEIELENTFSMASIEYVYQFASEGSFVDGEKLYTAIKNVYYVVELYLRGYSNKAKYLGYEEFLNLVKSGKTNDVIRAAHDSLNLHINRLKKKIAKAKKKIPRDSVVYVDTKGLLIELDEDLSICSHFPYTSANLEEFYFGEVYGMSSPVMETSASGFLALERTVYALYNELYIMNRIAVNNVNKVVKAYVNSLGAKIPFNLFEKVMNNYLFAMPYSDKPENLDISLLDAKLLMSEINSGMLNITELVEEVISKHQLTGYKAEYLLDYGVYVQNRVENLKDANYFGELFLVTPPE